MDTSNYFYDELKSLHQWHYEKCEGFRNIIDGLGWSPLIDSQPENIFIHTGLFKTNKLISTNKDEREMILFLSSGTSSSSRSHVYADRYTRIDQQRALKKIVLDDLDLNLLSRPNYYVIDRPYPESNSGALDARYAAIRGFSSLGRGIRFVLDENGDLNEEVLEELRCETKQVLAFGFTYTVYLDFLKKLLDLGIKLNGKNMVLLHGGGWKKLASYGIPNKEFNKIASSVIPNVVCRNYYGMIEQTGSISIECNKGYLHTNQYNSLIIRDNNFNKKNFGDEGIVQSISLLPKSYPGQSLLTEDIGICYGEDDCICGKPGKYFHILGRLKKTIVRGCSDVY